MSVRWVGGAQWLHQRSYLLLVLTRLMKAVRLNQNSKVAGKKTENLFTFCLIFTIVHLATLISATLTFSVNVCFAPGDCLRFHTRQPRCSSHRIQAQATGNQQFHC